MQFNKRNPHSDDCERISRDWRDLKLSLGNEEVTKLSSALYGIHTGDIENVYNLPTGLMLSIVCGYYGQTWSDFINYRDLEMEFFSCTYQIPTDSR